MDNLKEKIKASVLGLEKWVEVHDYKGYEPFDGLSSALRPLTFGNLFFDRLLLQLVRQSPWNLRPILGVKPLDSTIGRGYMAWGYCHMLRLTGDKRYRARIDACLGWLMANKSPGYAEYSWGKHFDFASRSGLYVAFEPILVWTALIAHAFLEAYEILGQKKYLNVADSVCRWIMKLPRNQTDNGFCLGYHNQDSSADIHNSNMVGAAVLARTAKHTGNREYLVAAKGAMKYSCTRQLPDGAWLYGENPANHWIDNFHTGYDLDSLKCYIEYSGDREYEDKLKKGLDFYKKHFFEESGRPKYYHDRTYPVDSQCASQAIDTLANCSEFDAASLELGLKVAQWTIEHMRDRKGYFYYRQYPVGIKARTPMLHWAQATTYKALTFLLSKMG
jgi:rhamnogalacturonyl hydrolase YesR